MTTNDKRTLARWGLGAWLVALAGAGAGCEWSAGGAETITAETAATTTADNAAVSNADDTVSSWPAEIAGPIHWLHTDVSDWAQTASLRASVGGGTIHLAYDKAKVWPAVDGANANPWVIVHLNGTWYAATFEWLSYGQTAKPMSVLTDSDHIEVSPLSSWRPTSGERIGLMVSGLARSSLRNVQERSNVVMVTWP